MARKRTTMIVSCGEALIDFVPAVSTNGRAAYEPHPGGSPFNIAVACARLGAATGFLGCVSSDFFGDQLIAALRASDVATTYVARAPRPTTLALVSLERTEPAYVFYDENSADRNWMPDVPLRDDVRALHFGSVALASEPAADRFVALMAAEKGRRLLTLDPNVRPSVVRDETAYRARLARALALADVVKISVVDLDWLAPGARPGNVAREWLARGAALVVVTHGGDGAVAYGPQATVTCAAPPIAVVDTVGAGDSFMGALLVGLAGFDATTARDVAALGRDDLERIAGFAVAASAITCTRAGADPPRRSEIDVPVRGIARPRT